MSCQFACIYFPQPCPTSSIYDLRPSDNDFRHRQPVLHIAFALNLSQCAKAKQWLHRKNIGPIKPIYLPHFSQHALSFKLTLKIGKKSTPTENLEHQVNEFAIHNEIHHKFTHPCLFCLQTSELQATSATSLIEQPIHVVTSAPAPNHAIICQSQNSCPRSYWHSETPKLASFSNFPLTCINDHLCQA